MKSHYVGLWLLLALSLAAVITVAWLDVDIRFAGHEFKKAPIDVLRASADTTDSVASIEELAAAEETAKVIRTDSAPQSILIFGDSMTFNLALRLAQYAKQNGHTLHSVNWDSSNTKIWAESDTLSYYIRRFEPTFIFISLGSNELYFRKPEARLPYVKRIIEMIGDIPYVWIGPPNWKEDSGINDMIASNVKRGSFFRSAGMEFKRKKDHIHPTRQASALWVDSIARWMPKSAHPILMEMPSDSIGKANPGIIFLKAQNKS